MTEERHVIVNASPHRFGYDLYIIEKRFDGRYLKQRDGEWIKTDGTAQSPTLFLEDNEVKALMDAFANIGIRPDREARNDGELTATKFHLEDLRKLLKIKP